MQQTKGGKQNSKQEGDVVQYFNKGNVGWKLKTCISNRDIKNVVFFALDCDFDSCVK